MRSRRASGIGTAVLLLAAALAGCAAPPRTAPRLNWAGGEAEVQLGYRGEARSVAVAGDFNAWNPESDPFILGENDLWTCTLRLAPGRYAYLLAVETDVGYAWRTDEANPARTSDGLGRELSLLVVAPGGDDADTDNADRQGR